MTFLITLTLFIFGTITASFSGVVTARLHTGQRFISGRSRCDVCDKILPARALVPIVSYFSSHGHAVCCGARLSAREPGMETLLGALFAIAYIRFGISDVLFFFLIALSLLFVLVRYDLVHKILPPEPLILFIITSGIFCQFAFGMTILIFSFGIGLLIALALLLINVLSKGRAMGVADAPLALGLSLLVGMSAVPGFAFAFWIGAIVGIIILAKRPKGRRMGIEIPFAPFLAAGFLLALFTQWNPFLLHGL